MMIPSLAIATRLLVEEDPVPSVLPSAELLDRYDTSDGERVLQFDPGRELQHLEEAGHSSPARSAQRNSHRFLALPLNLNFIDLDLSDLRNLSLSFAVQLLMTTLMDLA